MAKGGSLRKQKYIDTSYSVVYFEGHWEIIEAWDITIETVDKCNFILTII